MPAPSKLVFFSFLAIPAAALSISAYLINHPLSSSRTRSIKSTDDLSPSCAVSSSIRSIVNPRNHVSVTDSHTICLSSQELRDMSDEEILARFVKGFFGGWVFAPEKVLLGFLQVFALRLVPVGFSSKRYEDLGGRRTVNTHHYYLEIQNPGIIISSTELSRTSLPPMFSILFGGNFMILDISLRSNSEKKSAALRRGSYIDIGFGDDRKGFAGMHRFEVIHDTGKPGRQSGDVMICYSSMSCNPTVNQQVFPNWVFTFHKFYALNLFRDGVAEVLRP